MFRNQIQEIGITVDARLPGQKNTERVLSLGESQNKDNGIFRNAEDEQILSVRL